jgi:hypothetical protein
MSELAAPNTATTAHACPKPRPSGAARPAAFVATPAKITLFIIRDKPDPVDDERDADYDDSVCVFRVCLDPWDCRIWFLEFKKGHA